jgi:hypothetical protein
MGQTDSSISSVEMNKITIKTKPKTETSQKNIKEVGMISDVSIVHDVVYPITEPDISV